MKCNNPYCWQIFDPGEVFILPSISSALATVCNNSRFYYLISIVYKQFSPYRGISEHRQTISICCPDVSIYTCISANDASLVSTSYIVAADRATARCVNEPSESSLSTLLWAVAARRFELQRQQAYSSCRVRCESTVTSHCFSPSLFVQPLPSDSVLLLRLSSS